MWMICRHLIVETLARHGFDAIRGATTSPFEIEHNRFQKNWNSLCQKIDYANLNKFDWKVVLGTTMETQAQEASSFCNHALKTSTFVRGDYKELCELIVVYLGGHVESFKFKRPGASHHARFMAKAIYSTKMALLVDFHKIDNEMKKSIKKTAEFCAIFMDHGF